MYIERGREHCGGEACARSQESSLWIIVRISIFMLHIRLLLIYFQRGWLEIADKGRRQCGLRQYRLQGMPTIVLHIINNYIPLVLVVYT
jgi:hypothetical protein